MGGLLEGNTMICCLLWFFQLVRNLLVIECLKSIPTRYAPYVVGSNYKHEKNTLSSTTLHCIQISKKIKYWTVFNWCLLHDASVFDIFSYHELWTMYEMVLSIIWISGGWCLLLSNPLYEFYKEVFLSPWFFFC
jgi:hypothetical protein